jgi:hypothetical protein
MPATSNSFQPHTERSSIMTDNPESLATSGPPFVDATTMRVLSESVDNVLRVSILVAADQWAEYTFEAGTVTHRSAIATAVRRHTDRTVTGVTFSHRVGDGCGCYIATIEPLPATADTGHNI